MKYVQNSLVSSPKTEIASLCHF